MNRQRIASVTAALTVALFAGWALLTSVARAEEATTKPTAIEADALKACMPETLAGIKRSSVQGQSMTTDTGKMTVANGVFGETGEPKTGTLGFTDFGNAGAGGLGFWQDMDLNSETETEYTKTLMIQGQKALQTYNKQDKRGSIMLIVGGRVMVSLALEGISDDELKKAGEELPVKKLHELTGG